MVFRLFRIRKVWLVYHSISGEAVVPEYLLSEEKVKEYVKNNPMPVDKAYSEEDLLCDLQSSGAYTLPDGLKQGTMDYIADLLNELI